MLVRLPESGVPWIRGCRGTKIYYSRPEFRTNDMIGTMRGQREVIESLEGIRVAISGGVCDFDEYDFNENRWQLKERCAWPRPRARGRLAERLE